MTAGRRCHSIDFVDWLVGEFFSFKGKSHHVGQAAFELVVSASVSGVLELQICDPSGAMPSGSTSTLLTLQKKGKVLHKKLPRSTWQCCFHWYADTWKSLSRDASSHTKSVDLRRNQLGPSLGTGVLSEFAKFLKCLTADTRLRLLQICRDFLDMQRSAF